EEVHFQDGIGIIAVWKFGELTVQIILFQPQESQVIFGAVFTLYLRRIFEKIAALSQVVQCDICKCNIFFQIRSLTAKFAQPLPKNQGIIGQFYGIIVKWIHWYRFQRADFRFQTSEYKTSGL